LRVFENEVMRRIFGPKSEKARADTYTILAGKPQVKITLVRPIGGRRWEDNLKTNPKENR
jgi:hypothetical protein